LCTLSNYANGSTSTDKGVSNVHNHTIATLYQEASSTWRDCKHCGKLACNGAGFDNTNNPAEISSRSNPDNDVLRLRALKQNEIINNASRQRNNGLFDLTYKTYYRLNVEKTLNNARFFRRRGALDKKQFTHAG